MHFPALQKKSSSRGSHEYKYLGGLRIMSLLLVGFLAVLIFQTFMFIYQNIYESIGRVESIFLLQKEVGPTAIDFERLRRVEKTWEEKYGSNQWTITHDPFRDIAAQAAVTSTPSEPL